MEATVLSPQVKIADIKGLVEKQRTYFATGATKDVDFRIKQLKILRKALAAYEKEILEALHRDLRKGETEGYLTEIGFVLNDLNEAISKTKNWAKPKPVGTPILHVKAHSYIHNDPYGQVLVIAPWNYPVQLSLSPLVGAIAAGNTTIIKPSEHTPATSKVIADLIREYFDEQYVAVVEGAVEETQALLKEKFDYIFFTGSTNVGRIVYQAAAKHLTPVTLELGGKSPCVIDKRTHIEYTAKRIVYGKFINVGQTCIAPDYLLVHKSVKDKLITAMKKEIKAFFGDDPSKSEDYGRIVNGRHFNRLVKLMKDQEIIFGGETDAEDKYIAPTLLDNVSPDAAVMQEEIFGPILPILTYNDLDEAISFINERDKPLALYVFSKSQKNIDKIVESTSAGGMSINETIMHIANHNLPFGGVGASGIGAYHGDASFTTFSHQKSILHKSFLMDMAVRYPPFGKSSGLLKLMLKYLNK